MFTFRDEDKGNDDVNLSLLSGTQGESPRAGQTLCKSELQFGSSPMFPTG